MHQSHWRQTQQSSLVFNSAAGRPSICADLNRIEKNKPRSVAQRLLLYPHNFKRATCGPDCPDNELLPSSHIMSGGREFTWRDAVKHSVSTRSWGVLLARNKGSVSVIVWSPSHQQAGQQTSAWLSCQSLPAHRPADYSTELNTWGQARLVLCQIKMSCCLL